jgi:putative phosphonate metabolism protein
MAERYAVYFTLPMTDPIYQIASRWLDYDVYNGKRSKIPEEIDIAPCYNLFRSHTTSPRRYGFHATLKPPFRLKSDTTPDQLIRSLQQFSSNTEAFECSPLSIQRIGRFLALIPEQPCVKLNDLAAQCVEAFEPFRAPLNEMEYQNRQPEKLSTRQRALLDQWGYPYVYDEFRFHMTLTNNLPELLVEPAEQCLQTIFDGVLGQPFWVDRIYLFRQKAKDKKFKIISEFPLLNPQAQQITA